MSNDENCRWWKRPSGWIGGLEIFLGGFVGLGGCWISIGTDASMAGPGAAFSLLLGLLGLVVPGLLMVRFHPRRWFSQLLVAALIFWIVILERL